MLLMLEDNAERVQRFSAVLPSIDPVLELKGWRNAWTMIRELEEFLPKARLISLDHDLDPERRQQQRSRMRLGLDQSASAPIAGLPCRHPLE